MNVARRRVRGAGGSPTVHAGKVSTAGVRSKFPTPDDHFTAGPDCRVQPPGRGRVGQAGGSPTIRARKVPPAVAHGPCVSNAAPNDHFTASPYRRVIGSASR